MGSVGTVENNAVKAVKDRVLNKFSVGSKGRKGIVTSTPIFSKDEQGRTIFSFTEEQYNMGQKSVGIGIGNIPGSYRTYTTTGIILPGKDTAKIFNLNTIKTSERPLSKEEKKRFTKQGKEVV